MTSMGIENLILNQFGEFSGLVLQTSVISVLGFLISGMFLSLIHI